MEIEKAQEIQYLVNKVAKLQKELEKFEKVKTIRGELEYSSESKYREPFVCSVMCGNDYYIEFIKNGLRNEIQNYLELIKNI
jgi:predicted RNA-binding protein with EMAP domain